jgi:uncharacterized membrane protein YccC
MFESIDETAERNHLLRLLAKAIQKLEDAAAANSPDSKALGPLRAELVQAVKTINIQTDASIPQVVATLHRLARALDTMSDPLVREARRHVSSGASIVQGLQRREPAK